MKSSTFYLIILISITVVVSGVVILSYIITPWGKVYHDNLGDKYYRRGEVEKAIEEYKTILEEDPYILQIYHKLGRVYFEKGNYDKAMDVYKKGLEKDPKYVEILNDLGIAYFRKGNHEKAMKKWKEVLEIDPNFKPARKNLYYYRKSRKQ